MIATLVAAAVFISCDGSLIVAGPSPKVWQHGAAGWEQLHGTASAPPAADAPGMRRASCRRAPISNTPPVPVGMARIGGSSRDRSLLWSHSVGGGEARFTARLWTGDGYDTVVDVSGTDGAGIDGAGIDGTGPA